MCDCEGCEGCEGCEACEACEGVGVGCEDANMGGFRIFSIGSYSVHVCVKETHSTDHT